RRRRATGTRGSRTAAARPPSPTRSTSTSASPTTACEAAPTEGATPISEARRVEVRRQRGAAPDERDASAPPAVVLEAGTHEIAVLVDRTDPLQDEAGIGARSEQVPAPEERIDALVAHAARETDHLRVAVR